MSVALPAPIPPGDHPAPWWCPTCGGLECTWHSPPGQRPPSGPAPIVRDAHHAPPAPVQWAPRRRRLAPFPWSPLRPALQKLRPRLREHGTHACFVHGPGKGSVKGGCWCDPCRAANTAYERYRKRRTAPPYVDATRARSHVRKLNDQGVGLKTIAKRAGVSHGAMSKLIYGDSQRGTPPSRRIRPTTEAAILGVTVRDAAGGARVDATATIINRQTLLDRGWTVAAICRATGITRAANYKMPGQAQVSAGTARKVAALLDLDVPPRRSRHGEHEVIGWDREAERRDKLRRAAEAEKRAMYRAAKADAPPVLDLTELAAQTWRDLAACRLVPDDETWIFWASEADHRAMDACRAVCASCRVSDDCLANAIANGESGFWGGHTEAERNAMTKEPAA